MHERREEIHQWNNAMVLHKRMNESRERTYINRFMVISQTNYYLTINDYKMLLKPCWRGEPPITMMITIS